jgi:two-component system nitrate/nitrite response regulator NarP
MTRLLIAEDDPLTLEGIKLLLTGTLFEIVDTVSDGETVLQRLASKRPDMLLLDFDMPKRSGLDVLRTLRERGDKRPVVLLTGSMSDRRAYEALQVGLNGLVLKSAAPKNLLTCLDAVLHGRRWIEHEVLQRAMEISLNPDEDGSDPLQPLSRRERAIVALVLQGMRNKQIAGELGIAEGTVKVHLNRIYDKLGVGSRTELALAAVKALD